MTPLSCLQDPIKFLKLGGVQLLDLLQFSLKKSTHLKQCWAECLKNWSCIAYANSDIRKGSSGYVMGSIRKEELFLASTILKIPHRQVKNLDIQICRMVLVRYTKAVAGFFRKTSRILGACEYEHIPQVHWTD
ncbi:unnamed protein product [Fraxinus pennsylvanica]|uniref:Apple domain-containing protein n=1 Tax=Fraxinus pennsylvanica TaxID=56036 RepID=A0AAD2DZN1_9LAMI|nr:unnamed protein product [Fraxinus pennsylvanica]